MCERIYEVNEAVSYATCRLLDILHIMLLANCRCPEQLYERIVEVDEAVILPLGLEPNARNGRDAAQNAQ